MLSSNSPNELRGDAQEPHTQSGSASRSASTQPFNSNVLSGVVIEELSTDSEDEAIIRQNVYQARIDRMSTAKSQSLKVPLVFRQLPPLRDFLQTDSSIGQDETVSCCMPYLSATSHDFSSYNSFGIPHLDRKKHIAFLHKSLQGLPAAYTAADASRPWFYYWAFCGLLTLGEDVSLYHQRLITSVSTMQHPGGGFSGGHGQMSHLAPSYAIILSLAILGGRDAFDIVDRKSMWRWLARLKGSSGGFAMSEGGEEDVRGAYCASVIISLLDLPLEMPKGESTWAAEGASLVDQLPEYVARCQTFEGGISGRPDGEAHGAYAFCALGCLSILGAPHEIIPKYLDLPLLMSWLSARQYGPEGGLSGRTNKLVDGCYSHWVGGCWQIIETVLIDRSSAQQSGQSCKSLWSREGLIRYLIAACQDTSKRGGMRDKPGKTSDTYHTCYTLAGLSAAQHQWQHHETFMTRDAQSDALLQTSTNHLVAAYGWEIAQDPSFEDQPSGQAVFRPSDVVSTLHPIFVIPGGCAESMRKHFATKPQL